MRSSRLFNRNLSVAHPETAFLFAKGCGKTSLSMTSATNMSWDGGNWYVTIIVTTGKQMDNDWKIEVGSSDFAFLKYGSDTSLREISKLYLEGKQQDTVSILPESCLKNFTKGPVYCL